MTARQKSLYLSAKLYELAAEFTDSELQEMLREQFSRSGTAAIQAAIKALMALHVESPAANPSAEATASGSHSPRISEGQASTAVSRQTSSLMEIFADKNVFPTVSDIAKILRIPARNKEARDRYLTRISRQIDALTAKEREAFFGSVRSRLDTQPNNFISKWSRLIKEL